jgi:hypothetical protein
MPNTLAAKGKKPGDRVPVEPKTRTVTKVIQTPPRSEDPFRPVPRKPDPKFVVRHQDTAGLKRRWLRAITMFNTTFQSSFFANVKRFDEMGWKSAKHQAGIREALLDLSEDCAKKESTEKQLLELISHCFLLLCSKNPRMKEAVEAEGKLI